MKKIERRKLVLRATAVRHLASPALVAIRGGMDAGGASALCLSEGYSCWDTCVCW